MDEHSFPGNENPYRSPGSAPPRSTPGDANPLPLGRRVGLGALAGLSVGSTFGAVITVAMWLFSTAVLLGTSLSGGGTQWSEESVGISVVVLMIAVIAGAVLGGLTGAPLGLFLSLLAGESFCGRRREFTAFSMTIWTAAGIAWVLVLRNLLLATPEFAWQFVGVTAAAMIPGSLLAGWQFVRVLNRFAAPWSLTNRVERLNSSDDADE